MKSQYEVQYEKLVTEMILSNKSSSYDQLDLFMDFHRNSSTYYDAFCDCLYALSTGISTDILWITPSGEPYLAAQQRREGDRQLLTAPETPDFSDDLVEQLETALASLQRLSNLKFPLDFVSTM